MPTGIVRIIFNNATLFNNFAHIVRGYHSIWARHLMRRMRQKEYSSVRLFSNNIMKHNVSFYPSVTCQRNT